MERSRQTRTVNRLSIESSAGTAVAGSLMAGDIARKAMSLSNLNPNIGSWSKVRSMPGLETLQEQTLLGWRTEPLLHHDCEEDRDLDAEFIALAIRAGPH